MNTGAEAVETALKAARRWAYDVKGIEPNQAEIIAFNGLYLYQLIYKFFRTIPLSYHYEKHERQVSLYLLDDYGAHNYVPLPIVVSEAEGIWVTDPEGNKYIDMLSA
jgi:acetylornithine/succinyldiaminopimelate/putrescine aminotransferase